MTLDQLNAMSEGDAARELLRCCGSARWAARMAASRPFGDVAGVTRAADRAFADLNRADWLEAFAAHPAIGADGAGRAGGAGGAGGLTGKGRADWSEREQALVAHAPDVTRQRLADLNRDYLARFGYIFIVCAAGKTGEEMLARLERRLGNDADEELEIAAGEQQKITHLRLGKLLAADEDDNR